ncbi:AraC family transcriptional regulator [Gemmiger sp.]
MKLHEISRRARELGLPLNPGMPHAEQEKMLALLNIESDNFYQEIEMDDPLVQTQEDVSTTTDVVGLHSHTYYEIIFIRSGNLQYLIGTRRYRIRRGDVLLIAPGVSHRPLFLEQLQEKYARVVIWISPECVELLRAHWPGLSGLSEIPCMLRTAGLAADRITAYETAFRRGVREYTAAEPGWEAAVFANTLQILVSLQRDFGKGAVTQPDAEKRELLDEIMSYVEDHLAEHITLEDTALHFHVSAGTVSRLFRKRMKISYYRYVTQRRLIAAKTLIKQGVVLEEVAETVGFSDYSGFYRAFKHEYGISPAKFKTL